MASLPAPVHLSDARAVVAWHCPRRHETVCFRHPDPSFHVSCTISLDASQTKGVFRLRVPVLLKGASRQKPPVFAFISPDGIRTITYESEVPHNVISVFRSASVGLKFRMDKKVVLVAPSNKPLSPKNEAHGNALNMMQSLAQAAELTIYMSGKDLARSDVDSICAVDWAARGRWPAVPSQADIRTLYRGKGGWIVHPDHLSSTGSRDAQGSGDSLRESPPSYDELALPSPPRPRPAKRRREESQARESNEDKLREMAERIFAERHDRYCETIKEQLLADKDFRERIVAEHRDNLQHQMDERMQQSLQGLRAEMKRIVADGLQELEGRLLARLDKVDERLDETEEAVDTALDEVSDLVDVRMEEHLDLLRDELRENITDELKYTEDRIKNDLSSMSFTLSF